MGNLVINKGIGVKTLNVYLTWVESDRTTYESGEFQITSGKKLYYKDCIEIEVEAEEGYVLDYYSVDGLDVPYNCVGFIRADSKENRYMYNGEVDPVITVTATLPYGAFIDGVAYECYIDTEYGEDEHVTEQCIMNSFWEGTKTKDTTPTIYWEENTSSNRIDLVPDSHYNPTSSGYIEFTTPDSELTSKSINFLIMEAYTSSSSVISTDVKYALCTSDLNRDLYVGSCMDVDDEYQIASGITVLYKNSDTHSLNIPVTSLNPNTTYYLFLWWWRPDDAEYVVSFRSLSQTVIDIEYTPSGSRFLQYIPYIDDGTSWRACVNVQYD